jgi:hypothetical protein
VSFYVINGGRVASEPKVLYPEEDSRIIATEAGGRGRRRHVLEPLLMHIPVVCHQQIAGVDGDVRDDLQSADVAAGW